MERPIAPPLPFEANFNKITNLYRIEKTIKHKRNKYSLYDNKWKIILNEINNLIYLLKNKISLSTNSLNYTNNFKNIIVKIKKELNKSKSTSSSLTNLFLDSKKKEKKKLITNKLKEMISNINTNNKNRFNKSYLNKSYLNNINNINKDELELKEKFIKSLLNGIHNNINLYRLKAITLESLYLQFFKQNNKINQLNDQKIFPVIFREILEKILRKIDDLSNKINSFDLNKINQLSKQIIELNTTFNKIFKNVDDFLIILKSDMYNTKTERVEEIKKIELIIKNNITFSINILDKINIITENVRVQGDVG